MKTFDELRSMRDEERVEYLATMYDPVTPELVEQFVENPPAATHAAAHIVWRRIARAPVPSDEAIEFAMRFGIVRSLCTRFASTGNTDTAEYVLWRATRFGMNVEMAEQLTRDGYDLVAEWGESPNPVTDLAGAVRWRRSKLLVAIKTDATLRTLARKIPPRGAERESRTREHRGPSVRRESGAASGSSPPRPSDDERPRARISPRRRRLANVLLDALLALWNGDDEREILQLVQEGFDAGASS